ncbi:hypothetical protein PIB30_096248 [Stylosanthes scabra]|uniref:CCHC-type domain-containing protein n=1 Tax=Stylosanthes scabra TaxID=79078 RepID=A0ABU6WU71_9FABA|nr:hypothetical protein [Stylosanthes scabra]
MAIGCVVDVENPIRDHVLLRTFLRANILFDITKPLHSGIWLVRPNLPRVWIKLKYERILDGYCLKCGRLGHNRWECKQSTAVAKWNPQRPVYTPGMSTSRTPPLFTMQDQEARVDLENSDESAPPPPPHEPQQQGMGATNTEAESRTSKHIINNQLIRQNQDIANQNIGGLHSLGFMQPYPIPQQQPHGEGPSQRDLQQPHQLDITQDGVKGDQLDDITTKSFSDKAPQQAQMNEDKAKQPLPIKELMKQAFKNNNDFSENNNSVDIWNFRDNHNRPLGTDEQGRKIIQRKIATAPYIVEITEADEIMEESKPVQAMEGHWEVELAQNISNSLRIKRKRSELAQLCMAGNESGATTLAEETGLNKRIREDFATDMAEEAGLTTPQTPP